MRGAVKFLVFLSLLAVLLFIVWSRSSALLNNLGNRYYESANYKEAIRFYEMAIKISPDSWVPHLGLAQAYSKVGDYDMAINGFERTLRLNPASLDALKCLSRIYADRKDYEKALYLLRNRRDPGLVDSALYVCSIYSADTVNEAAALLSKGDSKGASALLINLLTHCEGNPGVYYTLGMAYFYSQDLDNAQQYLKKALIKDAAFYPAYKALGNIYFDKGDYASAEEYWRKAIRLNDEDAASYNDLGIALMNLERCKEALAYLFRAVELDPGNLDYIYSLASIYRDNNMPQEALRWYAKLNSMRPDYPNLHNDVGDIYANLGRKTEALSEYIMEKENCRVKIKAGRADPETMNDYAYALNATGDYAQAREFAEALTQRHPRYRQAHITLSMIYEKLGRKDLALRSLKRARECSHFEYFISREISRLEKTRLSGYKEAP